LRISTTSTRKMPNQTGSNPACFTIGSTIGSVSTIIEKPSRKQPRIKIEHDQRDDQHER